jgi:hypothetical protein
MRKTNHFQERQGYTMEYSTTSNNFYRHSGKVPLLGLILLGVAGLVAVPILGVLYGYLIFYIPFIYVNLFVVFGYVYAVSFVLSKAMRLGKIRNTLIAGLAAFGFGLLAEYVGWVAWIAALARDPYFLIEFFFPFDIIYIITELAKEGVWSLGSSTPTGAFLYAIWLAEAAAVIGGTTYYTLHMLGETPFCEESDAWADKSTGIAAFAPLENPHGFKEALAQGNFSIFNELKPIQNGNEYTWFQLYECGDCNNFFVLNVKDVRTTTDYRGRQNTRQKNIVSNLKISQSALSTVKRLFEEHQQMLEQQSSQG